MQHVEQDQWPEPLRASRVEALPPETPPATTDWLHPTITMRKPMATTRQLGRILLLTVMACAGLASLMLLLLHNDSSPQRLPSTVTFLRAGPATTLTVATTAAPTTTAVTAAPVVSGTAVPTIAAPATTATPTTTLPIVVTPLNDPPGDLLPGGQPWPVAVYESGLVHLTGTVPSEASGSIARDRLAAALGADSVIDDFVVDPSVPVVGTVLVRFGDAVMFDPQSDIATQDSFAIVDQWSAFLNANPDLTVVVIGNTDDQGGANFNQALAQRRADVVHDRITANGVDPSRIGTLAKGPQDPVADNATVEGRAANRRLEFTLTGLFG